MIQPADGDLLEFTDGKPDGKALHKTCFSCHEPGKDRDFVFTRSHDHRAWKGRGAAAFRSLRPAH